MEIREAPPGDHVLAGLAALAADGDVHAAERLFHALLPRVRNLARYSLRRDEDVDDVAQDALVALFRGLSSYRGEGPFRAWADRVVARSVFRAIEQRRLQLEMYETAPDITPLSISPDEAPSDGQSYLWRRALASSLNRLPWEQRQAIVLHFVVGMTAREVADEMDVPMETVRSRLRLGMGKLKSLFRGRMARRAG